MVGVATGVIERDNIIDGSTINESDIAIGVFSNGLHTNGYSLARKLIFESLDLAISDLLPGYDISIADSLLAPHTNYSSLIKKILNTGIAIKSISHITGGGLVDNVPRVIPKDFSLSVNTDSWKKIPIFDFLQNNLDIEKKECLFTNTASRKIRHVIASDGIKSLIREKIFSQGSKPVYSGYSAWRGFIKSENPNVEISFSKKSICHFSSLTTVRKD